VIRGAEIERDTPVFFDGSVAIEFGAIVGGERFKELRGASDQSVQSPVHGGHGAIVELADDGESGAALHEGDDAVRGAMSHDGVDFPMAKHGPVIDVFGAFGDVAFPGEPSPGIVGPVTFSSLFGMAAKMGMQGAAGLLVGPDALVDGFVADAGDAGLSKGTSDLLGAPLVLEQEDHTGPDGRVDSQVSTGAAAAPAGAFAGLGRPIRAIVATAVASDLAADGAGVPVEASGDVDLLDALPMQSA